jgi:hypothetical protein
VTKKDDVVVVVELDAATAKKRKQRYQKLVRPRDVDLSLDFSKVKFVPKTADIGNKENLKTLQNQRAQAQQDSGKGKAPEVKAPESADNYKKIVKEKLVMPQKRAPMSKNPIRDRQERQAKYEEDEKLTPRESPKEKGAPTEWNKKLRTTGVALYGAEEGRAADNSGPRLVQFHGRRNLLARRVEPVSESIIFSAAYLLDTGKRGKLYIWAGPKAPRTARGTALALAKAFKDKERPESQIVNIASRT